MKTEQIAKTAHSIHVAFCNEIGDYDQPQWDDVHPNHKSMMYSSIKQMLQSSIQTVEQSHQAYLDSKKAQGWKYGEIYNREYKLNPRIRPFNQLPHNERIKEKLFFECVMSFK